MKLLSLSATLLMSASLYAGFSPELILRTIKAVKQTGTTKPWQDINHEIRKFMLESSVDKQDLEKMSIEEVKSCYENNAWVAQCEIPSEDHLSPEAQAALNAGGSMLLPEFSRTTLSQRRFSI